jgi:predicted nucleic acid-binding protein
MIDETDRKFYDLALKAAVYLITGNKKHFPTENWIVSPAEFLEKNAV